MMLIDNLACITQEHIGLLIRFSGLGELDALSLPACRLDFWKIERVDGDIHMMRPYGFDYKRMPAYWFHQRAELYTWQEWKRLPKVRTQ